MGKVTVAVIAVSGVAVIGSGIRLGCEPNAEHLKRVLELRCVRHWTTRVGTAGSTIRYFTTGVRLELGYVEVRM